MTDLKIAVIGTSRIADSFVKSASLAENVEVAAVYSRKEETGALFADKHNIARVYTSLSEMLSSDGVDAVYIASPNVCHFEQARLCLENGKNVLCEKPMTVTHEQSLELFDIAAGKKLILLEAMKSMHSRGLDVILDKMPELGEVRTASVDFSQLSSRYPALKRGEIPNIFNPLMGAGALMDIGVYNIYFALEMFGKPKEVISHCDFLNTGADGSGTLIFVYDSLCVTLTYSKLANGFSGARILGENGAITVRSVSKLTGVERVYNNSTVAELYDDKDEYSVMSREIVAFEEFSRGLRSDYYDKCRSFTLDAASLMQKVRKDNHFVF